MPVVLPSAAYTRWLDPDLQDREPLAMPPPSTTRVA
ncbi:MAG: hypothetical protein IH577_00050 [Deltaproteobacteria bacterium]|nr:hypothetical protein [Deltaproteobacteria bacterium]